MTNPYDVELEARITLLRDAATLLAADVNGPGTHTAEVVDRLIDAADTLDCGGTVPDLENVLRTALVAHAHAGRSQ